LSSRPTRGDRLRTSLRPSRTATLVQQPKDGVHPMATGHQKPQMALPPKRKVPKLRSPRPHSNQQRPTTVHPVVPEHAPPVVPDRRTTANDGAVEETPDTLHVALVVPDLGAYRSLREAVYVIEPSDRRTPIKVHVLLGKDQDRTNLVCRYALTELGLVDAKTAQLQYPEELELGWKDD